MYIKKLLLGLALFVGLIAGILFYAGGSLALNVPPVSGSDHPAKSLSWWSRGAIDLLLRWSVLMEENSGYVTMVASNGQPIYSNAVGWADIDGGRPMTLDTRMRFASMTKPITAVAALILIDEGRLQLDTPVAQYLPEFGEAVIALDHNRNDSGEFDTEPLHQDLTIAHLLTFTAGIGFFKDSSSDLGLLWDKNSIYDESMAGWSLGERVTHMAKLPLYEQPGKVWRYGFDLDVLARVIELESGQSYAEFVEQRILQPLGMSNSSFLPPVSERGDLATVYRQSADGGIEEGDADIDAEGWAPGGSGLVSTVEVYMRFALMLWNKGEYQGVRILPAHLVEEMTRPHVGGVLSERGMECVSWGYGLAVISDENVSIGPDNNGDYWWGGYYGTLFYVSPSTGLVSVHLAQNQPVEGVEPSAINFIVRTLARSGLK